MKTKDWIVEEIRLSADAKKFGENNVLYPYYVGGMNVCSNPPQEFYWNLPKSSLENPRYDLSNVKVDERGAS